jgi:hypothetical protein
VVNVPGASALLLSRIDPVVGTAGPVVVRSNLFSNTIDRQQMQFIRRNFYIAYD